MWPINSFEWTKGGLRAAFFSLVWGVCAAAQPQTQAGTMSALTAGELAQVSALAKHPTWRALLHADEGKPQVKDPNFFTSPQGPDVAEELAQASHRIRAQDADWFCRFPARALWLSKQMGWTKPTLSHCDALQEFVRRAPLQQLDLIFASETLTEPSSMMGHIFLKVSGQNSRQEWVQHAITFYTDANTWNIPKLFFDSTVAGKEGHFALSPYAEQVDAYVRREQRGLWEYRIALTDDQRELIQLHIWELKQTGFLYFFQSYNCATLVNYILALAGGESMLGGDDPWLTPKDVLKRADRANLIGQTTVLAPAAWLVRHLTDGLKESAQNSVKSAVETRQLATLMQEARGHEAYLSLELAQAYNQYLRDERRKGVESADADGAVLQQYKLKHFPGVEIEAAAFKDPRNSPPDTQWSLGLQRSAGDNHVLLKFLPVSHGLDDDNRNYLSENELKLLELSIRQTPRTGTWRLEQWDVYAIQSYLPSDPLMGGLSGRFRLASVRSWLAGATDRRIWQVEGAVGKTWRIHDDMDLFALMGGGAYWSKTLKPAAMPQWGVIVREVFDMKTRLQFKQLISPDLPKPGLEMELVQTKQLGRHNALSVSWVRRQVGGLRQDEGILAWRRLY